MNVREKLVELLDEAEEWANHECDELDCGTCQAGKMRGNCFQQLMVGRLIDNGLMVQEWISVEDRLPEEEQDVILCTREIETYGKHHEKKKIYRNIYMGYFDGDEWLTSYCHGCEYIFRMNEKYPNETIEVTHWMPLPHLPKGD